MYPNDEFEHVATLLEQNDWIFAKTMPHNPHHYTLRKRWERDEDFVYTVQFMREHGYKEKYKGRWYTQFDVNDHFYWTMGAPISKTILINRKPLVHRTIYDYIAPKYDRIFQTDVYHRENAEVIAMLGDLNDTSILDVGCGTGLFLDYVSPKSYTGIDISRGMLSRLVEKHPDYKGHVVNTSLRAFSTPKRFDLIVALFGSASYLKAEELQRLPYFLSEGGRCFLMFYRPDYYPVTYTEINVDHHKHRWDTTAPAMGYEFYGYSNYHIVENLACPIDSI